MDFTKDKKEIQAKCIYEPRKTISTLTCPNITISVRKDGSTTRQVDFAIQKLFEGYTVIVQDHACMLNDVPESSANNMLFTRIMRRLEFEYKNDIDNYICYYVSLSRIPEITLYKKKEDE